MNSTLPSLQAMISPGGPLETCLLAVYNNDYALYTERVKILDMADTDNFPSLWNYAERFVRCLAVPRNFNRFISTNVDLVINLVFQDEADGSYITSGDFNPSQPVEDIYFDDVILARNLVSTADYTVRGVVFAVTNVGSTYFQDLVQATFVNAGIYQPPLNLSDYYLTNFNYSLNITDGGSAEYYSSLIITTLNSLGVVTPGC